MRNFELVLKAAGDPTRTRILKLLERGGLCVCQVQTVLGLAPSTVSKHLTLLKMAGLVEDRRNGKWIEYALAGEARNPYVKPVLDMLRGPLDREATIVADRQRLRQVKSIPLVELCAIAPGKGVERPVTLRARKTSRRERERV
jgi:ArsR family transcriptional regulator, arsenate/arsenite/antimonite-responsive transcriptional repressor